MIKGQTAVTAISLGVFVGVSYGRGCGGGGVSVLLFDVFVFTMGCTCEI